MDENTAVRSTRRATEAFAGLAWDACAAMFAEQATWTDHRPALGSKLTGPAEIIDNLRVMQDLGARRMDMTVLQTRGDLLALFKADVTGDHAGGIVVEDLTLVLVDTDGLIVRTSIYDVDQLDEATAELEALYHG